MAIAYLVGTATAHTTRCSFRYRQRSVCAANAPTRKPIRRAEPDRSARLAVALVVELGAPAALVICGLPNGLTSRQACQREPPALAAGDRKPTSAKTIDVSPSFRGPPVKQNTISVSIAGLACIVTAKRNSRRPTAKWRYWAKRDEVRRIQACTNFAFVGTSRFHLRSLRV